MPGTGYRLQNSAAEQGQDPPSDPEEMANPDPACVVRKLPLSKYKFFFERIPFRCPPADAGVVVPNHAATQITAGPELEIANETLAIIRWTTTNPGGTILHYRYCLFTLPP
jgi:hypothetical protein